MVVVVGAVVVVDATVVVVVAAVVVVVDVVEVLEVVDVVDVLEVVDVVVDDGDVVVVVGTVKFAPLNLLSRLKNVVEPVGSPVKPPLPFGTEKLTLPVSYLFDFEKLL